MKFDQKVNELYAEIVLLRLEIGKRIFEAKELNKELSEKQKEFKKLTENEDGMRNLFDDIQPYLKQLRKTVNQFEVDDKKGKLIIHFSIVPEEEPNRSYEINLNEVDTAEKMLDWLHHLIGKTWFNWEMVSAFIELLNRINKLNLPLSERIYFLFER